MNELELSCRCGLVRGVARGVTPRTVTRLVCMCDDCQTYAHFLDSTLLDANGGTEVIQTTPARIELTGGLEQIRCVRQSEKGVWRWYADCCRTSIANTTGSVKVPFASVVAPFFPPNEAVVGPVRARTQARFGFGEHPPGTHQRAPLGVIVQALRVVGRGYLAGEQRPSPFFDADGKPVVDARLMTEDERNELRRVAADWAAAHS